MASSVTNTLASAGRNFKIGQKKVFLPNHVITFIRPKPRTPPNFAAFIVPLQFNKLDLRDYLFHVYNVSVRSVRSWVNQQPLSRRGARGDGQIYRPRAQKMMMVELERPFVWPERPKDDAALSDYDKKLFDTMERAREGLRTEQEDKALGKIGMRDEVVDPGRRALAWQARQLLSGRQKWSRTGSLHEEWTEVEDEEDGTEEALRGGEKEERK